MKKRNHQPNPWYLMAQPRVRLMASCAASSLLGDCGCHGSVGSFFLFNAKTRKKTWNWGSDHLTALSPSTTAARKSFSRLKTVQPSWNRWRWVRVTWISLASFSCVAQQMKEKIKRLCPLLITSESGRGPGLGPARRQWLSLLCSFGAKVPEKAWLFKLWCLELLKILKK